MKVKELITHLNAVASVSFELPDGTMVPAHFHVTEMGLMLKNYVDCGGKMRNERSATFQLWVAGDTEHRLTPQKFLGIISLCDGLYGVQDLEVVVEYQQATIGFFGLAFQNGHFKLTTKQTACLAVDACGIPETKLKVNMGDLGNKNSCTPGGGCC
jgi:hypothetical protein